MPTHRGNTRRSVLALAAIASLVAPLAACGGDDAGTGAGTAVPAREATPVDYSARGPHAVGAVRLRIDDARPVEVLYPAERSSVPDGATPYGYTPEDTWGSLLALLPPGLVEPVQVPGAYLDLAASPGSFPLLVYSHGTGTMRYSYAFHAAHLASWGFVVASPEHPTRDARARLTGTATPAADVDTVLDTIRLLEAEDRRAGSPLAGHVRTGSVAVEGHSAGGRTAALAAYRPEVDTWIGDAPAVPVPDEAAEGRDIIREGEFGLDPSTGEFDLGAFLDTTEPPDKPSMMIVTERDVVFPVPERRAVFNWLAPPKRFVELSATGHFAFVNECAGIQANGGSKVAQALGFAPDSIERRLLENGCLPADAPVARVQATWNHLSVAQLNWVFGIDRRAAAASLEPAYLRSTFPGRIGRYVAEP